MRSRRFRARAPRYCHGCPFLPRLKHCLPAGCNLWRNWDDIQCDWGSLSSIIDHWGDYGSVLAPWAGPGHWHDADMLLIGNGCISAAEERTQMAIWSIVAAPLIMGSTYITPPKARPHACQIPNSFFLLPRPPQTTRATSAPRPRRS